jgi:SAM-dependent methyltransferase
VSEHAGTRGADYDARIQREIDIYKDVEEVYDLPPAFHYWSQRYHLPKINALGFFTKDDLLLEPIRGFCRKNPGQVVDIASLGAGNCDQEAQMAARLLADGHKNFRIDCIELNPHMLERGKQTAAEAGVATNLRFVETDINDWKPTPGSYQVCLALQSLHHFSELEDIFDKVRTSLAPDGVFLVDDMIGRNGHMRWPEALAYCEYIWNQMPDRYKWNHQLKRFEAEYVNWDNSESFEGIRSQDILPLLMEYFHFEIFLADLNITERFTGRAFGPNLDLERDEDRSFVDRVVQLDEYLIDRGTVKPTHLLALLRTEPVDEVTCYRHWTPEHCVRMPRALRAKARRRQRGLGHDVLTSVLPPQLRARAEVALAVRWALGRHLNRQSISTWFRPFST